MLYAYYVLCLTKEYKISVLKFYKLIINTKQYLRVGFYGTAHKKTDFTFSQ